MPHHSILFIEFLFLLAKYFTFSVNLLRRNHLENEIVDKKDVNFMSDKKKTSTFSKITKIVVWIMVIATIAGITIPVIYDFIRG